MCGRPSFCGEAHGTRTVTRSGTSIQRFLRLCNGSWGVIALCGACHETQRSGLAELNDRWKSVIATLCRVNGWDRADAEADIARSPERYRDLSVNEWDLDLAPLEGWVTLDGYPNLLIPSADRPTLGNTLE